MKIWTAPNNAAAALMGVRIDVFRTRAYATFALRLPSLRPFGRCTPFNWQMCDSKARHIAAVICSCSFLTHSITAVCALVICYLRNKGLKLEVVETPIKEKRYNKALRRLLRMVILGVP